jgi:sirohydrochlorin cobaltochelatase
MKPFVFILMICSTLVCPAHEDGHFVSSDFLASMKPGDKAALLMVHFGTTHDDTRALTIDALNQKAKETFATLEVREAWTSRIVIRRLKERGAEKLNPAEALDKLKADGFTHVLIQSSHIIEGVEMDLLRREAARMESSFKDIRVGNPLLYHPSDYRAVAGILAGVKRNADAVVWAGHGAYTPATAQYAMLEYVLHAEGHANDYVATIEGFPAFEDVEAKLHAAGVKRVMLAPFLFVAGEHLKNDIAGEWKEKLEKKGYQVDVFPESLGQHPGIRELYISHILFIMHHKQK